MIKALNNRAVMRLVAVAAVAILVSACGSQVPAPVRQATAPPPEPTAGVAAQRIHVVRPGDTLMGIGRLYGQSAMDLAVWNQLSDPNQLRIGQEIVVSQPGVPGGAVTTGAVAIAQPIDMSSGGAPMGSRVVDEPRGGRQPYSEQAWTAVRQGMSTSDAAASPTPGTEPAVVAAATPPASVAASAPQPAAATGGAWIWPANGPIISRFGQNNEVGKPNQGLSIGGNAGSPVVASAAGTVAYAGSGLRGYGNLVIIKHEQDYLTAYAHNQSLLVKEGDTVRQGQQIAELGSTDTDKPKLHFEIRRQGQPLDPMTFLPRR